MAVGSVQAWTVSGNDKHPFHIHINSFQLGSDVVDPSGYYRTGDWHDVFYVPDGVTASKVYFQVDQHTGKAVLHCHFLEHEDKGCMAAVTCAAYLSGRRLRRKNITSASLCFTP